VRLVLLASDHGSGFERLLTLLAARSGFAQVLLVVTDQRGARVQDRAEDRGIPTLFHPFDWYALTGRTAVEYYADLAAHCAPLAPDYILLSGWDRALDPAFAACFTAQLLPLDAFLEANHA